MEPIVGVSIFTLLGVVLASLLAAGDRSVAMRRTVPARRSQPAPSISPIASRR